MNKHDTIATRLSLILTKLNSGEKLEVNSLAKEFGVTPRTIQRDLNQRFADIPLKKENNYYFLESHYLGKLNFNDIKKFALISGIKELFPTFSDDFLSNILEDSSLNSYLIKGHHYEKIEHKEKEFRSIENAIKKSMVIELIYRNKKRKVHPYKFANVKGIWYLVALQDKVIKTFTFTKISSLYICDELFQVDKEILKKIEDEDSLWFSNEKIEVILKVKPMISEYFKRRDIVQYQKILEEFDDGGLLVSMKMSFEEETLQIVRYWIPNIKIVSPTYLQEKLEDSLRDYLR